MTRNWRLHCTVNQLLSLGTSLFEITDFWEEMNDVKMINNKKIGQPKLELWLSKKYSDTKWFTILFTEKKLSLNLRHILKILYGYFFIFFFFTGYTYSHTYIDIASTSKRSHLDTLLWCLSAYWSDCSFNCKSLRQGKETNFHRSD